MTRATLTIARWPPRRCWRAAPRIPTTRSHNEGTAPTPDPGPKDWPHGLHVVGNHIEDAAGKHDRPPRREPLGDASTRACRAAAYLRRPVDRSVGRGDQELAQRQHRPRAAQRIVLAGDQRRARRTSPATYYKTAINNYVQRLHKYDLIPILELHWVGPGTHAGEPAAADARRRSRRRRSGPTSRRRSWTTTASCSSRTTSRSRTATRTATPRGRAGATAAWPTSTCRGQHAADARTRRRACSRWSTRSAAPDRRTSSCWAACSTRTR